MAEEKTEPVAAEPEKPWKVTAERFVAFFDIMGFKERVANYSHEEVLNDLETIKVMVDVIEGRNTLPTKIIKSAIFSDSIFLFSEDDSKDSFVRIIQASNSLMMYTLNNKIPIKGSISFGKITAKVESSIFFGKPIISAHLLHEELCLYGVVLDDKAEKMAKKYKMQHVIEYFCPFKFGNANHYIVHWGPLYNTYMKTIEKTQTAKDNIKELSYTMSGRPRIYLDNTIKYFEMFNVEE